MCGEPWSGAAGRRFAALVRGCALLAEVFSVVHGVLHVDAYRPAGAQGSIDVRAALVREGYAELAEEPYESKVRVRGAWGPVASQDPQPALGAGAGGRWPEACGAPGSVIQVFLQTQCRWPSAAASVGVLMGSWLWVCFSCRF